MCARRVGLLGNGRALERSLEAHTQAICSRVRDLAKHRRVVGTNVGATLATNLRSHREIVLAPSGPCGEIVGCRLHVRIVLREHVDEVGRDTEQPHCQEMLLRPRGILTSGHLGLCGVRSWKRGILATRHEPRALFLCTDLFREVVDRQVVATALDDLANAVWDGGKACIHLSTTYEAAVVRRDIDALGLRRDHFGVRAWRQAALGTSYAKNERLMYHTWMGQGRLHSQP